MSALYFYGGDRIKSGSARNLGDHLQSRNLPFGISGMRQARFWYRSQSDIVIKYKR